jgi:glycosyltransferase involved in cell wall biosynthesis
MKLAIFSPSNNALTETFIQAHREIPGMEILFYYNGVEHAKLEGKGFLLDLSIATRIKKKLVNKLAKYKLTATQEALAESFLAEGVQCVLAEYGQAGVHILPIVKAAGIPLVVHFHGYDAVRHDVIEKLGSAYREMFSYASAVIAVSKVMYQKLLDLGCPVEKLILNTYGPHPDFAKVEAEHIHQHLVGLGRFADKKAPYYTILAFKEVIDEFPGARLTLAGDGPLLDVCKNLVRYYGIEQFVRFPGPIQREDYIDMLKTCRAYVQHSLTPGSGDMEGTPLSILEAQSAGVPVISTNHAGIPDVVVHEETGLLCDEHDVKTMSEYMRRLLESRKLASEMGKKGKIRINENYSLKKHLNKLAEVIQETNIQAS